MNALHMTKRQEHPLISIVTPVYNTPIRVLKQCIESVRSQTYSNWELCLVDDKSPNDDCRNIIEKYARKDSRIKYSFRQTNGGIVAASNDALEIAKGEFVGLLDHDDVLEPDALEQVVHVLNNDEEVDYVYTDEDLLDEQGRFYEPFRKPDWSPERFRNQMYVCHFSVIRRSLLIDIEGFRPGFDGSQDYDLILRVTEKARKIHHIPIILYHWRVGDQSVAANPNAKPYAYEAGQKAIADHLERVGIDGVVHRRFDLPGNYQVVRTPQYSEIIDVAIVGTPRTVDYWGTMVDSVELSKWSLLKHSSYRNLKIHEIGNKENLLNAELNTFFKNSKSEYIALVVDGTSLATNSHVQSYSWAESFVGFMQSHDVAMVGGYTWTKGARLKHAALSVGANDLRQDGLRISQKDTGVRAVFRSDREVSSIQPYLSLIRRDHFLDIGGLDESIDPYWAWVEISLKFITSGLRIISTPQVNSYHFDNDEEAINTSTADIAIPELMRNRWSQVLQRDPYSVCRHEQITDRHAKWRP